MKKGTLFLQILGAIVIFGAGVLFGIYCDKQALQRLSDEVSPQQIEKLKDGGQGLDSQKSILAGDSNEAADDELKADDKENADDLAFYGALKVKGSRLLDLNDNPVRLMGVSSHGLSWFPEFVTADAMKSLHDDWGINVFRVAMYTAEYNGYCEGDENNRATLKGKIDEAVNAAKENDMYIIIDWHILSDNDPNMHKEEAKEFFAEMSAKYADVDNVIYEICNEPNGSTSWDDIYSYANEVIPVIRKNASQALVLVGTPCWCQEISAPLSKPLKYDNIMYTFHFYGSTHKQDFRDRLKAALDSGVPVFVSEFGFSEASGSGNVDYGEASQWLGFLDENNLSGCIFNLSNKDESSAMIAPGCDKKSGWTREDLSIQGQIIYDYFHSK